jgi:hypothetical protein
MTVTVTDADRKRLAQIKAGIAYGATHADLSWLVRFAERLLRESEQTRKLGAKNVGR